MPIAPQFDLGPSLVQFNTKLRQWAAFTGKELEQGIREEGRVLLRDCINYTPPTVRGGSNDFQTIAPRAQQKSAEAAIEKDVRIVFKPLQDVVTAFARAAKNGKSTKVNYPRVLAYIREYAGTGRARAIETILRDFHFRAIVARRASPEIYQIFKAQKNATRILVLDSSSIEEAIQKIVKEKKKRVGHGKSGWNTSGRGLGLAARIPRWVAGKNGRGSFRPEGRASKFSITMENTVPHVQKNPDAIVGKALRRRVGSMDNRMNAMLEKGIRRAK